jgi:hypothetical protein
VTIEERLLKLARYGAEQRHWDVTNDHFVINEGHNDAPHECQHTDCVLVRTVHTHISPGGGGGEDAPEYSATEIAALRADFEAFARRKGVSPEVFALACPWAAQPETWTGQMAGFTPAETADRTSTGTFDQGGPSEPWFDKP